MRKMVLRLDCGIGTDAADFYLVPDDVTQEELDEYAWQCALQHAEMYGMYPESDREFSEEDDDEEDSWGGDTYTDDINGHFEPYNPEEHDGLRVGGGASWREF